MKIDVVFFNIKKRLRMCHTTRVHHTDRPKVSFLSTKEKLLKSFCSERASMKLHRSKFIIKIENNQNLCQNI